MLVAHRSGTAPDLTVSLDFPSDPPTEAVDAAARTLLWNDEICDALGMGHEGGKSECVVYVGKGKFDALVEVSREAFGAMCKRDPAQIGMDVLGKIPARGFIVTCRGGGFVRGEEEQAHQVDFTSRWFGPQSGVPEDPVTGSAHCSLAVYWGEKLGKSTMWAGQASPRGGILQLELRGETSDRVRLTGHAAMFCEGALVL